MATELKEVAPGEWEAAGGGASQVLIEAVTTVYWCDSASAPQAGQPVPAHTLLAGDAILLAGDAILLPKGISPFVSGGVSGGSFIFTVYPDA
ncbi:hypothetical protein [Enterobacter phage ST22]|nr:hypothetical protein [Enterobacter phage ST22]